MHISKPKWALYHRSTILYHRSNAIEEIESHKPRRLSLTIYITPVLQIRDPQGSDSYLRNLSDQISGDTEVETEMEE